MEDTNYYWLKFTISPIIPSISFIIIFINSIPQIISSLGSIIKGGGSGFLLTQITQYPILILLMIAALLSPFKKPKVAARILKYIAIALCAQNVIFILGNLVAQSDNIFCFYTQDSSQMFKANIPVLLEHFFHIAFWGGIVVCGLLPRTLKKTKILLLLIISICLYCILFNHDINALLTHSRVYWSSEYLSYAFNAIIVLCTQVGIIWPSLLPLKRE